MRKHTIHTAGGMLVVVARYSGGKVFTRVPPDADDVMFAVSIVPNTIFDWRSRVGSLTGAAFQRLAVDQIEAISGRPWDFDAEDVNSPWNFLLYAPWVDPPTWTGDRRRRRPKRLASAPRDVPRPLRRRRSRP